MEDYSLLKEKKIAILAGGWSAERDISLKSGAAVSMALEELSIDFNFIDLNNDDQISLLEVNQSISLIFQIVDLNQDGFISKVEISELKNIIDSLK